MKSGCSTLKFLRQGAERPNTFVDIDYHLKILVSGGLTSGQFWAKKIGVSDIDMILTVVMFRLYPFNKFMCLDRSSVSNA